MKTLWLILAVTAPFTSFAWEPFDEDQLVSVTTDEGAFVIALTDHFAPKATGRFRELVASDFYSDKSFYRVIDGFVAQGGVGEDESGNSEAELPGLAAEFQRAAERLPFTAAQSPDMFAAETGFVEAFPAARNGDTAWAIHCPGTVAFARGNEPDSGSTEFYIVIGQAPRYLDRNMSIIGRVVSGMEVVQRIRRGDAAANGIIEDPAQRTRIRAMALANADERAESPRLEWLNPESEEFSTVIEGRRHRTHPFFARKPPAVIDVCQVPIQVRTAPREP